MRYRPIGTDNLLPDLLIIVTGGIIATAILGWPANILVVVIAIVSVFFHLLEPHCKCPNCGEVSHFEKQAGRS